MPNRLNRIVSPFCRLHPVAQWGILLAASLLLVAGLEALALPAALMLGPMLAAIGAGLAGASIRIPRLLLIASQSVVGCMVGSFVPASILIEMGQRWPLFAGGVVSVVVVATILGWILARRRVLPGTTAVWGASPGAASAMVLMADSYGADARLVAFMQYLRVVLVTIVASVIARIGANGAASLPIDWLQPIPLPGLAVTVALTAAGVVAARWLPAAALLAPMIGSAALQDTGLAMVALPPVLLAICYAIVGWTVGLRFTPSILGHAVRALPKLLISILTLIAVCGGLAALLAWGAGIDPLTAYLATSPGGADSVAIIAASSPVDVPFVMAMQTFRFLVVMLTGPGLARFIAARTG